VAGRKALVRALGRAGFKSRRIRRAAAVRAQKTLARHGFSPAATRALRALGLSRSEIAQLRMQIATAQVGSSTFPSDLASRPALTGQQRAMAKLSHFAAGL
jgi:hypothetical protein